MEKYSVNETVRRRIRSGKFSPEESLLLVKLIAKYKQFILNKATNAAANHAKEVAWTKITKQFNHSSGSPHKRNSKNLKGKWDNLQRNVRIKSKSIKDSESLELDEVDCVTMGLISAADSIYSTEIPQDVIEEEINKIEMDDSGSDLPKDADESEESESDDVNEKSSRSRSQNFSPQESKLLLECVKKEKKHVFSKDITSKAIAAKNQAWSRIADSYNKLSPQKRSGKCLRTKFTSIKNMARNIGRDIGTLKNIGNKHEALTNDSFESIKEEPSMEDKVEDDSDQFSDQDDNDYNDDLDGEEKIADIPPDPLSSVLNGDSGIGSTASQPASWNWQYSDNKDIIKLQTELLHYQMETAKLERKRVEEAMAEEAREREARATERALRLRAARLDAVAAASRLPPPHPAVQYRPEEARALHHINQYQES